MRSVGLACLVGIALFVPGPEASGSAPSRLTELLREELGLTRSLAAVERATAGLERGAESLDHASRILSHGAHESLRRLRTYRVAREARERQTRRRGRSLYKLARGGVLRIVFDVPARGEDATASRIARGRTLRWLVRHDLEELQVHRRAETRAAAELLSAGRELQALAGLHMMQDMQRHALTLAADQLDPALREVHRRRRNQREGKRSREDASLLELLTAERRALNGHGIELLVPRALVRPVRGKVIGSFGSYEDPVLQVPMVRNGIEIEAGARARVRVVAAGRVAFAGELPGFDQIVVVDHGDGYLSLTGRLLGVRVVEGQELAAGAELGTVAPKSVDDGLGRTVYLELRHGERPIDPSPYLR